MNAIEIRNLTKSFRNKSVLNGLNMTVPVGSIYGFIGENGSGKSTTEKIICGLITSNSGEIKLFGKNYNDSNIRTKIGVLIENPGCYPNYSVWNNMMLQALNLNLKNPADEIRRVLRIVRMDGAASNKYKNCSLGMKQRIGIAMALLGSPQLLILDEPMNGLDADGMRIIREVLVDITKSYNCTVIISSHILGELEKIATHYGIVRQGKMIKEMTALELLNDCPTYIELKTKNLDKTRLKLENKYKNVRLNNNLDSIIIYDNVKAEEVVSYLYQNNDLVIEIKTSKIGLEDYYINLMGEKDNGNSF